MSADSVRIKTIKGLFWSFSSLYVQKGIQLCISILITRMLSPSDYGVIGMLTIFIELSKCFIDSGFGQALTNQKKNTKKNSDIYEESSVFYLNIFLSFLFIAILFFSAPFIADFFKKPILLIITRVISFGLLFESLSLVQRSLLIKTLNFKLLFKVDIIATLSSGLIGLTFAFYGFGVWSLVSQILTASLSLSILLWFLSNGDQKFISALRLLSLCFHLVPTFC